MLDDNKTFRKHITMPVYSSQPGRFMNLRRLLEALCLRRTKALLQLPNPETTTHLLDLSATESQLYHEFGECCRHAIDFAVSGHSIKKANHHVIQAILGMRLFCNDGPRALAGKWESQGLPSDPEEALSFLQANGTSICVQCQGEIITVYQADDQSSGVFTICQHLICGACQPKFEADLDDRLEDGRTECPICAFHGSRDSFLVVPEHPIDITTYGVTSAYPTKLLSLLDNLRHQKGNDKS
jgi:hypothetical protein